MNRRIGSSSTKTKHTHGLHLYLSYHFLEFSALYYHFHLMEWHYLFPLFYTITYCMSTSCPFKYDPSLMIHRCIFLLLSLLFLCLFRCSKKTRVCIRHIICMSWTVLYTPCWVSSRVFYQETTWSNVLFIEIIWLYHSASYTIYFYIAWTKGDHKRGHDFQGGQVDPLFNQWI